MKKKEINYVRNKLAVLKNLDNKYLKNSLLKIKETNFKNKEE